MDFLKGLWPIIIILAIFLTMRAPTIKNILTSTLAIKARIVIGCLGAGVLLGMAMLTGDLKAKVITILIVSLVIYGAVSLQNKYLYLKK